MDKTTEKLVDYVMGVGYSDLAPDIVAACKTRVIDSVGCAIGAYDVPVSQLARAAAARYSGTPSASVLGCAQKTSVEMAAFANGVMLRYLDTSDQYRLKSGGHPSDVIPPVLAVAEAVAADGPAFITAVTLAYEIYCAFCDAIDINETWDQPVYGVLASALASGKLLGLSRAQMGNAASLALAPNMAMYQTRRGELSNWKGCAAANASRNGVFAALLARDGFTGPTAVFEGKAGLFDIIGKFDWPISGKDPRRVSQTHLKCFPLCYHGQSAVWAALELRDRVRAEDVAEIRMEAYRNTVVEMANDPSRWAPKTHETADHSLPYVVATALLDGEVGYDSFSAEKLTDPRKVRLMSAVKVEENGELNAQYPESAPSRMIVVKTDGSTVESYVRYPKGHAKNALGRSEIEKKFLSACAGFAGAAQSRAMLDAMNALESVSDVSELLRLFLVNPGGRARMDAHNREHPLHAVAYGTGIRQQRQE